MAARCPTCGAETNSDARFCAQCGSALGLACASCDAPLVAGARFCSVCGAPIEPRPPAEEPPEQRRTVSILFADLVGFTARSDGADPEDVRATLVPFHRQVRADIERFGGTLDKFIGDAAMGVFGAPVAHEDDAIRAVRAALRILDTIDSLNDKDPRRNLAVRIAVNTGEAMVSFASGPQVGENVAGDVVNTASRMQSVAPVGGVVVGEATYRATLHAIEYEELPPVEVKGKAEPLLVWRAVAAADPAAPGAARPAGAPFVGRERELTLLRHAITRCVEEPAVQLVTVLGEPGIGKSRLVAEFLAEAGRGGVPNATGDAAVPARHVGRSLPYGEGIAFWALAEIVRGEAGIVPAGGPADAHSRLAATVRSRAADPAEAEWMLARLEPLLGLVESAPEAARRDESFAAWARFLELSAGRRPMVLVFEDLHLASSALVEFIGYLTHRVVDVPLLVICTGRPELLDHHPDWGGGKRNAITISLTRLSDDQTFVLLSALLLQAALPDETRTAVVEGSGGNPLYAQEFIRMLSDRGLHAGIDAPAGSGQADLPVPETIQALIAARLDALPPGQRLLIQDAAVVGRSFWPDALAEIGGRDLTEVVEGFRALARREFIRPVHDSTVEGEAEYTFAHALVQDVSYRQLPRAVRARKHAAAAAWLEGRLRDRPAALAERAEFLAHHYERAIELWTASGLDEEASRLAEPAARALALAADRALALDATVADAHYVRALELLPESHADYPGLLAKAARIGRRAGRLSGPEALDEYQRAIDLFRALGNRVGLGETMVRQSMQIALLGGTARARAILEEAVAILESEPPGRGLAFAYAALAESDTLGGNARSSLEWTEKALALSRQNDLVETAVMAQQLRGNTKCELADFRGGLEDFRGALAESLEHGIAMEAVVSHAYLGEWTWLTAGPDAGLEHYRDSAALAARRGLPSQVLWSRAESLWLLYDGGRWDELLSTADEVAAGDRAQGGEQLETIALTYRSAVMVWRGRVAEAAAAAGTFLPRAREIADLQILAPALGVGVLLEQARGDLPAALVLVRQLAAATTGRSGGYREQQLPVIARACAAAAEPDLLEELVAVSSGSAARHAHGILTARAVLAESRERMGEAAALYAEAEAAWESFGCPFERAMALLGAARCARATGEDASPAREAADAVLRDLGAMAIGEPA